VSDEDAFPAAENFIF